MNGSTYDVVVVGGRVAGSLTAILLARAGHRVLVIDRARFPSTTLSTHFFRGNGLIRVLDMAGMLDAVLALGPPRLTCEYAYFNGDPSPTIEPPQDPGDAGYCLSVRRETLDAVLLDGARRAGAHVRTATSVSRLITEGERVTGVLLGDGSTVMAGLVVGADGRRSMVARAVNAADRERHRGKRALYYRYVADMPSPSGGAPDGPEFSLLDDELAYIFPSDAGLTCVAISVNLAAYARFRHSSAQVFDELLARHTGLWQRYADSTRHGRLFGSGPLDDYVRQPAGPGWALVGDSGIHQDPWSGVGMDSAAVTAAALVECITSNADLRQNGWQVDYERNRDENVLSWFHDTVACAGDLSVLAS
ncbi:MAG TPA: NAD(P)/FAD-dependent oxidoreductase [Nocardioidaceae bacterium]